jgi:SEC-C motif-containing protein
MACPCGGGEAYERCCGRFHRGEAPATAEELMRARYSAFARGEHHYLWRTLHRDHADRERTTEREWLARVGAGARTVRYQGLRILDRDGPDADGVWRVLFHARVRAAGKDASFVELSSFAGDDEAALKYVGGATRPARPPIPESIAAFERR